MSYQCGESGDEIESGIVGFLSNLPVSPPTAFSFPRPPPRRFRSLMIMHILWAPLVTFCFLATGCMNSPPASGQVVEAPLCL